MSEKRCMSCMKIVPAGTKRCPYCGFEEAYYHQEIYQLPVGHKLQDGRYQLGRVIGEGGFGITYIGWDTKFSQVVAVKEFFVKGFANRHNTVSYNVEPYRQSDEEKYKEEVMRAKREATTIKQFAHCTGIVRVEDYFEENNTVYIVMEYVEGITLGQYIKEKGAVPAEMCLKLFKPMIEALSEVHRQGMLHRDISLDNIIYQRNDSLKLLDFGSVKKTGQESQSGTLRPGYAPREQYDGKNQGTWTDVYSVCVCLYNCLTGDQLEDSQLREEEAELFSDTARFSGLKKTQKKAIAKGLKLNYQERIQTMGDLYQALYEEKLIGDDDDRIGNDGAEDSNGRRKARRRKMFTAAGVGILVLAVIGRVLLWPTDDEPVPSPSPGVTDGPAKETGAPDQVPDDEPVPSPNVTDEPAEETGAPGQVPAEIETWIAEDGTKYIARKVNGMPEGTGKAFYMDGSRYEGDFHDGLREGTGSMFYNDGSKYNGGWVAGKKEGTGTLFYSELERYEGQWVNGKREGTGTMYYKDGSRYEGGWSDNKENGAGILYSSDGTIKKQGIWKNGSLEE